MSTRTVREELLIRMKEYFGSDMKRINHALEVLKYAESILQKENGDYSVVVPAAILHDIGIKECERKYNSTNGQLQEKEGPPVARAFLEELGLQQEVIIEVCRIIASHHSPGELDTLDFKIIWDSDWLVNISDEYDLKDKDKLRKIIDRVFLTATGRKLAMEKYLSQE